MLSTAPEASRSEFPDPDDDALSHSRKVAVRVRQAIQASGGVLPFDRYMEIVLYEPGLGYYVTSTRKFGRNGDFVTAPELGALFGRCLARQCADVLKAVPQGSLLEFGAGSGALAVQVLDELADLGALPEAYLIVELSPVLRDRQRQALERVMQRVP
ncbi:MAG: SAM-dependent methyltransferase, partial [Pseudomonadota bacterium]|nr:SAM-dependent methyltransferase [Pseudomonadota bacterium]